MYFVIKKNSTLFGFFATTPIFKSIFFRFHLFKKKLFEVYFYWFLSLFWDNINLIPVLQFLNVLKQINTS